MSGAILLLPQYVFTAWCLVKHMDNFTFTFTPTRIPKIHHYDHKISISDSALCEINSSQLISFSFTVILASPLCPALQTEIVHPLAVTII
jgi:hypothetical protein